MNITNMASTGVTLTGRPDDALRQFHKPPCAPFAIGDAAWRARKLAQRLDDAAQATVAVADPYRLAPDEHAAILALCARHNLALVRLAHPAADPARAVKALAAAVGLTVFDRNPLAGEDGLTELRAGADAEADDAGAFIPYTRRPLNWHTDGYYNTPERQVRGMVLYCAQAAASGGDTFLLDHELAYLLLHDRDPALAAALWRPTALTIPEHRIDGRCLRPARSGPVFSTDADGHLHMRYTARTRSVVWEDHPEVRAAAAALRELLDDPATPVLRLTLAPGDCLVCNNVLHGRTAYDDDATRPRRLLRARCYERVAAPAAAETLSTRPTPAEAS